MKIFNLSLILTFFCITLNAQDFTNKVNVKKDQVIEVISKINQSMNMGMEMVSTISSTANFKVVNISESDFKVRSIITKMKSSSDIMDTTVEYDSEKPDAENPPEMVQSIKGKLNVEKEFLINRTTLAGTNLTKSDSQEEDPMEAMMSATGSNESAIATEMLFLIPKGKKPGDSWTTTTEIKGNKSENTYTLKEVKDKVASVDFKIAYTIDQAIPMVEGSEVNLKIKINSTGNITVSTETGLVKKKLSTTLSEGTMDMMGQSTPVSMNTTVDTTYNIK